MKGNIGMMIDAENTWGRLSMSYNLTRRVEDDIIALAHRCRLEQAILFGSRARGDNRERSDIDLAVSGGNITDFTFGIEDEVWTLLMFDVVNLDRPVQPELLAEIDRDGVVLYEKA